MSYIEDESWNKVKQIARVNGFPSDWSLILTLYYNEFEGKHQAVYLTDEVASYRVIAQTDQGQVIVRTKTGEFTLVPEEEAKSMRKLFAYIPATQSVTVEVTEIPELKGQTVLDKITFKYVE